MNYFIELSKTKHGSHFSFRIKNNSKLFECIWRNKSQLNNNSCYYLEKAVITINLFVNTNQKHGCIWIFLRPFTGKEIKSA